MEFLNHYWNISPENLEKLLVSVGIIAILTLAKILAGLIIKRRVIDVKRGYLWRRAVLYIYTVLLILLGVIVKSGVSEKFI